MQVEYNQINNGAKTQDLNDIIDEQNIQVNTATNLMPNAPTIDSTNSDTTSSKNKIISKEEKKEYKLFNKNYSQIRRYKMSGHSNMGEEYELS